jgi:hypothetical protein
MTRAVAALLIAVLVVGCSSAPPPPATSPARGKIVAATGEPLQNVVLNLEPINQTAGGAAQAVVKTDGTFVLQTFRNDDGALPGKYKVWLQPSPAAPRKASPIPAKYRSPEESDLTVLINPGDNNLSIQLKGDAAKDELR